MHCLTGADALGLTQMLEKCDHFEISHLYFYFNDWPLVAEFWTALLNQLKRFPVKQLETFSRGMLGARMEDLKEIWESCILEKLEVGGKTMELGDPEGWQRIEELVAKVGWMNLKSKGGLDPARLPDPLVLRSNEKERKFCRKRRTELGESQSWPDF